jgi:hypothetical protein
MTPFVQVPFIGCRVRKAHHVSRSPSGLLKQRCVESKGRDSESVCVVFHSVVGIAK